ncbi:MAG TPA: cation-efflux pump [Terriglobales bacterium]|nr:cation-efflux pump [Terriglobales bacterium]
MANRQPRQAAEGLARAESKAIMAGMRERQEAVTSEHMRLEKRAVALNSVFAALVITTLKIVVGLATRSLGVLSEAAHSGLDLIAALVTFFSVRVSDKPADAEHQYGHGKVESFSAFVETGLLLLTCIWILYEAGKRLFFSSVEIEPTAPAFAVMFLSMAIDVWRSRALGRMAKKYDSQALEADALHFSTDILSSAVVILGLALVWLGRAYHVEWLRIADPIAALFVACVVVTVSWRLARRTLDTLLDAAPPGVRGRLLDRISRVDGVLEINRVRIRKSGSRYFADVSLGMARDFTFQRSEQVSEDVTARVREVLPDADVMVHSVPRARHTENIFDRIRAVAAHHNFNVHDISVQDIAGELHVEQHLELDERLSMKKAHDEVTRLEAEVRAELPEIATILTHIESEPATIETGEQIVLEPGLEQRLRDAVKEFPEVKDVHEFQFKRIRDRLYVSCHCTLPDEMPLSRVHDVQTALETRFKHDAPELFRVLIHPEPVTDNRR